MPLASSAPPPFYRESDAEPASHGLHAQSCAGSVNRSSLTGSMGPVSRPRNTEQSARSAATVQTVSLYIEGGNDVRRLFGCADSDGKSPAAFGRTAVHWPSGRAERTGPTLLVFET